MFPWGNHQVIQNAHLKVIEMNEDTYQGKQTFNKKGDIPPYLLHTILFPYKEGSP